VEEEEEMKTPLPSTSEDGEDLESTNEKYFIDHDIQKKGGHHQMSLITGAHRNENCQESCKYPIICKILRRNKKQYMTLLSRIN
jgi:hypothetical protein